MAQPPSDLPPIAVAQQLSDLPPLAIIAFGVTLAIIFVVRYFGISSGAKLSPQKSAGSAEVAAVIVDPTALNNATAAVKDLVTAIKAGQDQQDDHAHMICRRVEALADKLESLTRTVSDLVLEMARSKR